MRCIRGGVLCSIHLCMLRPSGTRLLVVLAAVLAVLMPIRVLAQDDPNEQPLGDVARNLRKNTQLTKQVIDDDNLTQVMEQGENRHPFGSSLKNLMGGEGRGFQVSAPDATCSLAFTANVKALLANTQYTQMDLPAAELAKLEGPATIEGDALTVSILNATNWHMSELDVALTVVKKADAAAGERSDFQDVRPEKKPDVVMIYKMREAAAPWERVVYSAPLNLELAPGDEWHWAIVQAKGYPPERVPGSTTAQADVPSSALLPANSVSPAPKNDSPAAPTPDHP